MCGRHWPRIQRAVATRSLDQVQAHAHEAKQARRHRWLMGQTGAACDGCNKWRLLPVAVDPRVYPKDWICRCHAHCHSLNTFGTRPPGAREEAAVSAELESAKPLVQQRAIEKAEIDRHKCALAQMVQAQTLK